MMTLLHGQIQQNLVDGQLPLDPNGKKVWKPWKDDPPSSPCFHYQNRPCWCSVCVCCGTEGDTHTHTHPHLPLTHAHTQPRPPTPSHARASTVMAGG
ncbi:hypothetical protein Pcinc_016838 [Petrolisthes cinctipes]|uniref:Uncharacterized protein n=1 Tax=Petrolisthes cinctipes TaxID=88211 RepID=A0AAE1FRG0_PETCI|nr:hypothetical protein Pcinc_016838 [Petrolisthes cinctipes]